MSLRARLGTGAVAVATAVVLAASPAFAHVTVSPKTAAQGGFQKFTFSVPNEQDNADTTQIEVQLPTDHPIASVSVEPKPGWTYKVTTTHLAAPITTDDGSTVTDAVSQITWSGGTIKPGEFDEFSVSAGTLPTNAGTLTFKALQTYSNGDVVRWIDVSQPGQPEPAHPAPSVTLTKVGATDAATGGGNSSDGTARTLGIVGIVVGALGLAAGGVALRSKRTPRAAD